MTMIDDSYLFEQYLDGTLQEEALKKFLVRLKEDKDFAARFELYKRLDEFMRWQQQRIFSVRKVSEEKDVLEINELENIEKEIRAYYGQKKNIGELRSIREKLDQAYENLRKDEDNKTSRSSWMGIAASIAILISLSIFYFFRNHQNLSSEELFNKYYLAYPAFALVRGDIDRDIQETPWQKALKQYEAGNYQRAFIAFETAEQSLENKYLAKLYEGICLMELREYGDAAIRFKQILFSGNHLLFNQACWYLALCRIKQQRIEDAIVLLKKIDTDGNVFHLKARRLLDELE